MCYKQRYFYCLLFIILSLSFFIRIYDLEIRPLHHDEGINGWFIDKLIKEGVYQYSPQHYHGPTFFYIARFFSNIFGLETFSIRLVSVFFGFILCATPLLLYREMSRPSLLATIFLLSISPANLFYSRYAIHETVYVCFYLISAIAFYYYFFEGIKIALPVGSLFLASAAASKETIVIIMAAIFSGMILTIFASKGGPSVNWKNIKKQLSWKLTFIALGIFFGVLIFWFGLKGTGDFFKSYLFYLTLSAKSSGHEKPWYYFIKLLWEFEVFVLIGGLCGGIAALIRRRSFDLFCLGWAIVVIAAHSLIPYKTPWIIINMTAPLCFLFGILISYLEEKIQKPQTMLFLAATFILFSVLTVSVSYNLSFKVFEEPENRYTYVHTFQSAHKMEKRIKSLMDRNKNVEVAFVTDEYWPFPFLFREYEKAVFHGSVPEKLNQPIIVARDKQHDKLIPMLKKPYAIEKYQLRPSVNLELFISRDLL